MTSGDSTATQKRKSDHLTKSLLNDRSPASGRAIKPAPSALERPPQKSNPASDHQSSIESRLAFPPLLVVSMLIARSTAKRGR